MIYKNLTRFFLLLVVLLSALCAKLVTAESLRIAVASNFLETAKQLSKQFERESGHSIQLSSGSSGKLYLQIINGAPFDLFLSADTNKPHELVKHGFAIKETRQTYANGKLSLWLKDCNKPPKLDDLKKGIIGKIAIANPKLAPYGLASQQLLKKNKLWIELQSKLVQPENISQVAQLVKIGVVDAAFIANSDISRLASDSNSCQIDLNENDYSPIDQQLVIISASKNISLAQDFVLFMQSDKTHTLINNMGYLVPDSVKIAL